MSDLRVQVYAPFAMTPVADEAGEYRRLRVEFFETVYPGGVFGEAELTAYRDITEPWGLLQQSALRVVIREGLRVVYEGWMQSPRRSSGAGQAVKFPLAGAMYEVGERRKLRRLYADGRVTEQAWEYAPVPVDVDKFEVRRSSDAGAALVFVPGRVALVNTDAAVCRYAPGNGEKVKRVVFSYDLTSAGGEDYTLELYDEDNAASLWSVSRTTTGSSTGSQTVTLATTSDSIIFRLKSDTSQTPAGGSYGEISGLVVNAETNNSGGYANTLAGIAADLVGEFSDAVNALTDHIGSGASLDVSPFVVAGRESMAEILARAGGYGDGSGNAWAWYFRESEYAFSPDGKPVLVVEQYPALTDYDYIFDARGGRVEIEEDRDQVRNWITVTYEDEQGRERVVTPDDDSTLRDDESISRWGRREGSLEAGLADQAGAVALGVRYLGQYGESRYYLQSPIELQGAVLDRDGAPVPVSHIRAGKRLRVKNFMSGVVGVADDRLTFLVNRTRYYPERDVLQVYAGAPGGLERVLGG